METKKEKKDREARERDEQRRIGQERAQGAADLAQHNAGEQAMSDEDKAAAEELARQQQEEALAAERARAEEEQRLAEEAAAEAAAQLRAEDEEVEVPADMRALAPGSVLERNGVEVELLVDTPIVSPGFASEQVFASWLVQDRRNFAANEARLRLVYSPMTGAPAPLSEQRLPLEEMTEAEAAIFAPPPPRPKK